MSIIKKDTNPYDLTDDETKALGSSRIPDEVRAFAARRHDKLGTETAALMKVAARARAEVEAIVAVRQLQREHGELADLAEAKENLARLERRAQALEATAHEKDAEIRRLIAAPAAAVHSGD